MRRDTQSIPYVPPTSAPARQILQSLVLWAMRLLALIALGICGYLFYETVALNELPAGCGPGSSCEQALNSKWSQWMGIPVSVPAAAVYFLLFVAAVLVDRVFAPLTQRIGWCGLAFFSTLAAGAGVWFIVVQERHFAAFCPWCISVHACGLLIALLVVFALRLQQKEEGIPPRQVGRPRVLWPAALLALPLVAALANGQRTATQNPSVWALSQRQHQLDWHDFPLLGASDAPHIILVMDDYTCPHCQRTHPAIEAMRKRYGQQIAVVSVPVPMNRNCNPWIHQTSPNAATACELAKIALAVWRAKPAAFDEMDQWLFEDSVPPTPEEARTHAASLVGESAFNAAQADPWADSTIHRAVDLYHDVGAGVIPKIITPQTTFSGEIDDPRALFQLLEKELGLKPAG